MEYDLIFDNENIIGYSWEVKRYLEDCIENEIDLQEEGTREMFRECADELDKHDGLVYVVNDPMGALFVYDLEVKKGRK